MSRARLLKPGFFANDELAELPMATRMLFAGLWTIADRDGRLEDRPKRIKGELFRYDDLDVDAMLTQLHDAGFVVRYEADGQKCVEIVNFLKHQRPHNNEVPSVLPPRREGLSTKVESGSPLNVEPRTLNLEPSPEHEPEDIDAGSGGEKPEPKPRRSAYTEDFEAFWSEYPKGHGIKSEAFSEWKRLDDDQRRQARDSLPAFRAGERWRRGFILDCQRFLKKLAFESPPEPWSPPVAELPEPLRKRCENWTSERLNDNKPVTPYPEPLQAAIDDYLASLNGARR